MLVLFDIDASVSPKACAEEIGYTFLPCVLAYLHRAPGLIPFASDCDQAALLDRRDVLTAKDVDAVVVPVSAFFLLRGRCVRLCVQPVDCKDVVP